MLVGNRPVANIYDIPAPATKSHSALLSFEKPFYQVGELALQAFPGQLASTWRKSIANKVDVIDEVLNDPRSSGTQKAYNWVSDIAGSLIATAPLAAAGGAVGGAAISAAGIGLRAVGAEALLNFGSRKLSQLASSKVSHFLPTELTVGKAVTNLATSYSAYKGFTIPEHVMANYHKDTDTLDWHHAISEWSSDNYGFLLGGLPFAGGYIAYKGIGNVLRKQAEFTESEALNAELSRLFGQHESIVKENKENEGILKDYVSKVSELQKHLETAVDEGHLTPEEHDWYLDYLFEPEAHEKLNERALSILKNSGIPYDRVTGKVWFSIIGKNELKNFKGALSDEVASQFTDAEQKLISNYIVHNRLDSLRSLLAENPNMVHGLKGYTAFLDKKFASREAAILKADKIIKDNIGKNLQKNELFSQNSLYKHLKKMGVRDIDHLPYTVPENVAYRLKLLKKQETHYSKLNAAQKMLFKNEHLEKYKEEIKQVKLLSPKEELLHLQGKLLKDGKLIKNFNKNQAYHRLEELSQLWANAKHLLDRIHLEHEYEKQQAFNEVLKRFVEMVDSNATRFADPNRVTRYLQSRIESSVPYARQFKPLEAHIDREVKAETKEELVKTNTQVVEDSSFEGLKAIVKSSTEKLAQLNANENALTELIKCALNQ